MSDSPVFSADPERIDPVWVHRMLSEHSFGWGPLRTPGNWMERPA